MDELKTLLTRALPESPPLVDAAADVARGQRALQRRRTALAAGGGTLVVAAAAAAALVATQGGGSGDTDFATPPRPGPAAATAPPAGVPDQGVPDLTPGYAVAEVPVGWVVQGGTPQNLTLARADDPDRAVTSFKGKLVVMLADPEFAPDPTGSARAVAGRPGLVRHQGDVQVLDFQEAAGRWVTVQAPDTLGWDADRLARWAAGITVLPNAQPGLG
jgi:hypothetical protein